MSDHLRQYDHMTAEELAAVLRADLNAEEKNALDSETLLYVIQCYAEQAEKPPKTAREAFEAFHGAYLADSEERAPVEQEC